MRINPTLLRAGWRATWPSRGPIPTAGPPRSATGRHPMPEAVGWPSCPGSPHRLAFDTFAVEGLERLELLHQVDNHASCRVAEKGPVPVSPGSACQPPSFPRDGHVHIRQAGTRV